MTMHCSLQGPHSYQPSPVWWNGPLSRRWPTPRTPVNGFPYRAVNCSNNHQGEQPLLRLHLLLALPGVRWGQEEEPENQCIKQNHSSRAKIITKHSESRSPSPKQNKSSESVKIMLWTNISFSILTCRSSIFSEDTGILAEHWEVVAGSI